MKKLSILTLIIFFISYSSFGQTRMLMNNDGIGMGLVVGLAKRSYDL